MRSVQLRHNQQITNMLNHLRTWPSFFIGDGGACYDQLFPLNGFQSNSTIQTRNPYQKECTIFYVFEWCSH